MPRRGRLREAGAWVRERGLSVDDDLTYVGEYEHITLARVLMAQGTRTHDRRPIRRARALLERLLVAAEAGGRWRSVIEILVLQALAQSDRGRGAAGLDPLGRALTLAEPEGYVRTFVAEGAPMADMLGVAASVASRRSTFDACSTHSDAATAVRSVVKVWWSRSANESLMSCGFSPPTLMAPVSQTSWSSG